MRIGVLTGGGDCPGLNAVIRAVVRKALPLGDEVVGFRDGWRGVLDGETVPLDLAAVRGILPRGGTVLGTSRTNPYGSDDGPDRVRATLRQEGIEALIPIGGEDTLGVAAKLAAAGGIQVVGVPKTIDNDLRGTDFTFGFDTAVGVATDAIDRLHTTGDSHHRTLVVEVMGRHAGWIALHAGMAGGATVVLIPERPFDVDAVAEHCRRRFESGYSPIVVVSEGAHPAAGELTTVSGRQTGETDAFGHVRLGGIGEALARAIEERTGRESRAVVLGHVQRGGTPTPFDRVLATRFGLAAVDAVHDGATGVMVALHGTDIVRVPISEATANLKLVPASRLAEVEVFFG